MDHDHKSQARLSRSEEARLMMEKPFGDSMPTTIASFVANRLREEIRDGTLPSGTRLRQAHIASTYGVSTTPVREAFAALEREGMLQSSAHRGVVVFEPTAHDLREIYEIRIPLEGLATRLGVPNLTADQLRRLAVLLDRMAAANARQEWKQAGGLNNEFHSTIYRAAERPRLCRLIEELRDASRAYIGLFPKLGDRVKVVEREHRAILDACLARRPGRAAKAMEDHLLDTVRVISRVLDGSQSL
jgi:DNA-binding GntR family transcriptional regulator